MPVDNNAKGEQDLQKRELTAGVTFITVSMLDNDAQAEKQAA